MTRDELLRIIEKAVREGTTELDLAGNGLTELPPEIGKLTQLKKLILGRFDPQKGAIGNQLQTLPPEFAQLQNLSVLNLSNNQLSSLPLEIVKLQNLSELYLHNNQLTTLLPEFAQLYKLSVLYLYNNQLTSLPPEFAQLQNLRELYLHNNQLTSLPPEFAQLHKLSGLYLNNNQLTSLPPEFAQLHKLSVLSLNNNQLTSLPPEISQLLNLSVLSLDNNQLTTLLPEFARLPNLSVLFLGNNQLATLLPEFAQLPNLSVLSLNNNQLTSLPPEIAQLQNLSRLFLRDNPLPIPPEILNKVDEPQMIVNYYLQNQAEPSRPLNEAKVLLVGEAKVGKTSLVKRLLDNKFNRNENMTKGINIRQWPIAYKDCTVQLNVWDFGGQEIMHATHQFFLTKRSLYLLVLDARQDEDSNRIEYWLKIIRSFGGNSPIIVVGNQIDQKSLDIDRRGLKRKYPNIVSFIETSCSTGKGIEKLAREIKQQIAYIPHVFDTLPESWFAVKAQLEDLEKDYIEYHQYEQICTEKTVTDKQSQTTLIGFLHDLGIALNFRDDPRLQHDSILNPEWVTNAVYSILNDNALMTRHKGILERNFLHRILDRHRYPEEKHLFILDIMGKFELCFPLEGYRDKKYLLPDLLSKEEPETGDWNDILPFQYHYNVLPSSIISRFIVRLNQLISKNTYWRNGVVLAKGSNKALVKADKEDRKIFICVSGNPNTRRILLESIRDQFDYIHSTIPGIEIEEKVPLPDRPDVLVDYKNLLDMEAMNVQEFVPSGVRIQVRVRDLLAGIETYENREQRLETRRELTQRFPPPTPLPDPKPEPVKRSRNPWQSGLFYLFLLFAGAGLFVGISHFVSDKILLIIILGCLLVVTVVGIFQLMQDGRIAPEHLVTVITKFFDVFPSGKSKDSPSLPSEIENDKDEKD